MGPGMFDGLGTALLTVMIILMIAAAGCGACIMKCSTTYNVKILQIERK